MTQKLCALGHQTQSIHTPNKPMPPTLTSSLQPLLLNHRSPVWVEQEQMGQVFTAVVCWALHAYEIILYKSHSQANEAARDPRQPFISKASENETATFHPGARTVLSSLLRNEFGPVPGPSTSFTV